MGGRSFVGKDPVSGKKQYVTKTIRGERREAEVALGRMLGEIEDGQYAVPVPSATSARSGSLRPSPTSRPR